VLYYTLTTQTTRDPVIIPQDQQHRPLWQTEEPSPIPKDGDCPLKVINRITNIDFEIEK
jgi:hypothetical protein